MSHDISGRSAACSLEEPILIVKIRSSTRNAKQLQVQILYTPDDDIGALIPLAR
jgi:hypothetical protein